MNILDAEDLIKGLPDEALTQEAQMPSGQLPQFLVVSEIQRRTDMRKRYEAQQQQPQGTVAEQIVQEGIMGMMPQQPIGMPQQMPQQMPPMGMAAGGITSMPGAGALAGFQAEYIDPLLEKAKVLAQTARVSVEEAYEALKREAQMNMPSYGMLAPSGMDLPDMPSIPMPERRSQEEMAQMFSPDEVAERLANRPSLMDDTAMTPMDFFNQRVLGREPQEIEMVADAQENPGLEPATPIDEILEVAQQSQTDASNPAFDFAESAFPSVAKPAGGKEVQSVSAIQKQSIPRDDADGLGLGDLIEDSRRMAQANALMQLGAGIAGGDLSKGISAAGIAASKGMQDARTLAMRERLAEYQAGREDLAREEKAGQFERTFGLSERKLEALIEQNASTTQRETLRTLVSLFEGELDQTKKARYADQIQQILTELRGEPMVVAGMQSGAGDYSGFSIRR